MNTKQESILADLKQRLTEDRYKHTIGVMYTASSLCMRYGLDISKGMLAGALHDCGKLPTIKDYIAECEKYQIPITDDKRNAPHLLHADMGVYFAQNRYFIEDEDILHAILVHTTGCPNMSLLDKIIFIADYIEPGRDEFPNLNQIRRLAYEDIDRCIVWIAEQTLEHLKRKNYYIGKATIETYNFYSKKVTI